MDLRHQFSLQILSHHSVYSQAIKGNEARHTDNKRSSKTNRKHILIYLSFFERKYCDWPNSVVDRMIASAIVANISCLLFPFNAQLFHPGV